MKKLLNISTYKPHMDMVGPDWGLAKKILNEYDFQGMEVYPTPSYPLAKIPCDLTMGLHLRFFVFLKSIWQGDQKALKEIFGDLETAEHFFGGLDKTSLLKVYEEQINWGNKAKVEYAVFHASQADLKGIVDWNFPWTMRETIDISAQVVNELSRLVLPDYPILFENLWWPNGLRLDSAKEVERLFEKVDSKNTGLVLDTGHVINKNADLSNEEEAIEYLLKTVRNLGELKKTIKAVHLTKSLSGTYLKKCRNGEVSLDSIGSFWDQLGRAHIHVSNIDQHDAFDSPSIGKLFDLIEPEFVVFEFAYNNPNQWRSMIKRQLQAMNGTYV